METKDKLWLVLLLTIAFVLGFWTYKATHINPDLDCLLEKAEALSLDDDQLKYYSDLATKGIFTADLTVQQVIDLYWYKHPKSRMGIKLVLFKIMKECEI